MNNAASRTDLTSSSVIPTVRDEPPPSGRHPAYSISKLTSSRIQTIITSPCNDYFQKLLRSPKHTLLRSPLRSYERGMRFHLRAFHRSRRVLNRLISVWPIDLIVPIVPATPAAALAVLHLPENTVKKAEGHTHQGEYPPVFVPEVFYSRHDFSPFR